MNSTGRMIIPPDNAERQIHSVAALQQLVAALLTDARVARGVTDRRMTDRSRDPIAPPTLELAELIRHHYPPG
jgi:hypothetical protein